MDKFEYIGLFLTKESRSKLLDLLPPPFNCKMHLDHCTLLHKSQMDKAKADGIKRALEFYSGKTFLVTIIAIGWNDKAMAFKCIPSWIPCMNKTPHITICTFGDGNPVNSNTIEKWIDIESIVIETKLDKR